MSIVAGLCLGASAGWGGERAHWEYGIARAKITPAEPLWMGGFAARTRPAEGTLDDLWVQALVLRPSTNGCAVLVAADLVGIPQWLYETTVERLHQRYGLDRTNLMMAASHTHSGPVLRAALEDIYPLDEAQRAAIAKYSDGLAETIVATVGEALTRGEDLAQAVDAVLARPLRSIEPGFRAAFEFVALEFGAQPSKAELEEIARGVDYRARWAKRLLREMNAGQPFAKGYPRYPVQVWRLGSDQLWIALGGEVAVEYALGFEAAYGQGTWVTGYANDVMAYIPSKRIWEDGGYQAGAFEVYGLPATRWAPDIEERITGTVDRLVQGVRQPALGRAP